MFFTSMGNTKIKGKSKTTLVRTFGIPRRFVICLTALLLLALGWSSADAESVAPMQPSSTTDHHYLIALNGTGRPNLAFNVPSTPAFATETSDSQWDVKWLTASPELVGFDKELLHNGAAQIGQMSGVYSVIVVRNGYLVLEQYFREGSRLKPHNIKSATKSVLSALTGIAINKGYLRLDQPISDFLPQVKELDDPRKNDITVRHLLTMTSGLDPTSYQAYNSWIMNGSGCHRCSIRYGTPRNGEPGWMRSVKTGRNTWRS